MITIDLLVGSIGALLLVAIAVALIVPIVRRAQRRKALEQFLEGNRQSGLALVRYVQLNRQCSEEKAYQYLAAFVKKKVPIDDHSYIDRMLTHDRQGLVEQAQRLLVDDPDELDKI